MRELEVLEPNALRCVVKPYNALLTTHWLLDYAKVSVLLDNEVCSWNIPRYLTARHSVRVLILMASCVCYVFESAF